MPKVRQNLITLESQPTQEFETLFNELSVTSDDNLYNWIKNNLV
jgi:hypothetical protein